MKYRIVKITLVVGDAKPSYEIQHKGLTNWWTMWTTDNETDAKTLFDSIVNTGRISKLEVIEESND